jgi:hypothetical protein
MSILKLPSGRAPVGWGWELSSEGGDLHAAPGYAFGQLRRALESADPTKTRQWLAVLDGMSSGRLTVGSRTPVADTPAWVTLEVAHGGFATGRCLAEAPLDEDEQALVARVPAAIGGQTDRERLNLWYLSDDGMTALLAMLPGERYRVEVPEEAALPVVAWLVAHERYVAAAELAERLRPLLHRLRLAPRPLPTPRPSGALVRLEPADTVAEALRTRTVRARIAQQQAALGTWLPLYDALVTLWCRTVEGEVPRLAGGVVVGGWPCQVWPADWAIRRAKLLAAYQGAKQGTPGGKTNAATLWAALRRCERDSAALTGAEVGMIRRALANTVTRHGEPGSARRLALRAEQAAVAARPLHADLAAVLADRLAAYPPKAGIPDTDAVAGPVAAAESATVPEGSQIPAYLLAKAGRALEAPVEELVRRGVISSGEVLARVLPQITSHLHAAGIADPDLAALYAQTYAAFRRRRSLLLLNLEHQVTVGELPWVAAMAELRERHQNAVDGARGTVRQSTLLALSAFPYALLPNPLISEFGSLLRRAELPLPLVEEVAADIFMGTFTVKWRDAARLAARLMDGTLYARYYDLPPASSWPPAGLPPHRWRRRMSGRDKVTTADDFAASCRERAAEAAGDAPDGVAVNGAVLEQSQILTTHNLAALVVGLALEDDLRVLAPDLAERTFDWIGRRHAQPLRDHHAGLLLVKNTAYAFRQAIFYLSFCRPETQAAIVAAFGSAAAKTRLAPAANGLANLVAGKRFDRTGQLPHEPGRRFLGWSVGSHWMLTSPPPG